MASTAYPHLNTHWKSTCRILLGAEVGELSEYSEWLYENNGPRMVQKSEASGKDVVFTSSNYSKNARWISFDEVDLDKEYPKLSINEIKDIDSVLQAISERIIYAGNIILGNSKFVDQSSTITECFYVSHSERVAFSKHIAYSSRGGYSENIFGCYGFGPVQFAVKCSASWDVSRCLCVSKAYFTSSSYFSHGLTGCSDCIFCFNVKNKRNMIGNLQLQKEKYLELKKKLVGEFREKLMEDKRLPSIFELVEKQEPDYSILKETIRQARPFPEEKTDKSKIEKAFSETTNIVLEKPLSPIDRYSEWLSKNSAIHLEDGKSCASGKPLIIPDYAWFLKYPRNRLITQQEADFIGDKMELPQQEVESLSISNASSLLNKLAFFSPFWYSGTLKNNIDSPLNVDSVDCYRGALYLLSKSCAFCFSPRSCEYSFGDREGRHNTFCVNCNFSTNISRSFGLDSCNKCTGCYFCHNCENIHDSILCFNVKNRRYAIGNVEVGREKFLQAKKLLLDWINKQLDSKNKLDIDIYRISDF
ncbi:MAG: hypothetical protein ABIG39_07870 [Candidatus Micrarchaeota archaeon]